MKKMNSFAGYALSLVLLSQAVCPPSFAGNLALMAVGSVSIASAGKDDNLKIVGLVLIVMGSIARSRGATMDGMNSDHTQITAYTRFDSKGKGIAGSETTANLSSVLETLDMDALAANERGASDVTSDTLMLDHVSKAIGMEPAQFSGLLTKSNAFASGVLQGERFASKTQTVSKASVARLFGHPLSSDEWQIVTNYLDLRNISIASAQ